MRISSNRLNELIRKKRGVVKSLEAPFSGEDLDVFIAPNRENVERLKSALRSVFDDPDIDQISAARRASEEHPSRRGVLPRDQGLSSV